ncbi:MAG TPA: hypothetical protein VHA52_04620 [Candidatus Babeliaceae bacterium]|nr:hypothetical protein [Candidatus Babeliaceae bacterium]
MSGVAGKIIGMKIAGAFVSCEVSCTINFNQEMIPASAVDSGRWKEFIAGIRDWNAAVNGNLLLEAVGADIKTILTQGFFGTLPIFLQFSTRPSATTELLLSGNVLFQSGGMTAPATGKATWTVNLQGSGPLNSDFQDYPLLIDAMPAEQDYPIIVNEDVV